jgi:hypothetical protein
MADKKVTMGASDLDEPIFENTETIEEILEEAAAAGEGDAVIEVLDADEAYEDGVALTVEDLDPAEELWPGGPTAAKIISWKQEHGDVYVTSITMDQHIVWRTMNRFEYKNHVKNIERLGQNGQISQADVSMLNEELIAEMCILFPKFDRNQLNGELAGVPSIIAQEVMEASGFVALEVRQL